MKSFNYISVQIMSKYLPIETCLPVENAHLFPFTVSTTSIDAVPSFLTLLSLMKKRMANELLTIV